VVRYAAAPFGHDVPMSDVDEYFASLDPAARHAFEHVRRLAMSVAPDAADGTSYGMAALRHRGKPLLGFRQGKGHLSVYPFSPQAVDAVRDRLAADDVSKGTIRFTPAAPLPDDVVLDLVRSRMAEIDAS
jgi:uncharacterized protein YdhG (YjbR/CyaY superfamily)